MSMCHLIAKESIQYRPMILLLGWLPYELYSVKCAFQMVFGPSRGANSIKSYPVFQQEILTTHSPFV